MAQGQKAKTVEVKLSIDGDKYRMRSKSRGTVVTCTHLDRKSIVERLAEHFDELYRDMEQEVANGTTR